MKTEWTFFNFEDNCVSTCRWNFFQLWQEDVWTAVNVLKNGPKISDPNNRQDTQLNLFDINGKLG